jgi:FkbM family methyltransferase
MIEKKEIEVLDHILKGGMTIFDIGCSYGDYSSYIIDKMFGEPFELHCFEPVTDFFNVEQSRMGHYKNIHLNNIALTDKRGMERFYRIQSESKEVEGCSSFTNRPVFKNWPFVMDAVNCSTLDDYIAERGISHIDLMKIDVEGAEFKVLRGGRLALINRIIDIIQLEYGETYRDAGITMQEIIDYMAPSNYVLCNFDNGFTDITKFVENYDFGNYYLIRKELL